MVKFTFSAITQKLLVVSTWNKDRYTPLDELHKNVAHTFFARCTVFGIFAICRFQNGFHKWAMSCNVLVHSITFELVS